MGFIEQELSIIQERLFKGDLKPGTPEHERYYIAQQALAFANDPRSAERPSVYLAEKTFGETLGKA